MTTLYVVKKDGRIIGRTRSFKEAIRTASAAQSAILRTGVGYGKRVTIDEQVKPGGKRR